MVGWPEERFAARIGVPFFSPAATNHNLLEFCKSFWRTVR